MKEDMKRYDVYESIKAQKEYVGKTKSPHFAPTTGKCWSCNKNIYEKIEQEIGNRIFSTGIDVEQAESELVTGCPHCNRSYCS